jgi:dTDP-4-dehydrorhamnose 3,5-epimerase-like enzyme
MLRGAQKDSLGDVDALVLNCPTEAYNYTDPDHYRLPYDSPEIPYVWKLSDSTKPRHDAGQRDQAFLISRYFELA